LTLSNTANPRAVIDETAFRDLVDGRAVTLTLGTGSKIDVILSDIGWARMLLAIEDARGTPRRTMLPDPEDDDDL
jgi:hypothetical protein